MNLVAAIARFLALPDARTPTGLPAPLPAQVPSTVSPWRRIAMKYDVRRISKNDLRSLAEELFVAGAISRPDLLLLSLSQEMLAENCPDWDYFETLDEPGGRRDWICEVEARLASGHPNADYVRYLEGLLSLLKRAEDARTPAPPAPPRVILITEHRTQRGRKSKLRPFGNRQSIANPAVS